MEQVEYLKRKLTIPDFVPFYTGSLPPLGSYELILLVSAFTILGSFVLATSVPIYLVIGFLMPLYFVKDRSLSGYWPWLALLLLLRTVFKAFPVADTVILVCLWHPNIDLSKYLTKKVNFPPEKKESSQ